MEVINTKINTARYTAYKDSGVEWLGEIPAHWEVIKLKRLFGEKKKTTNIKLPCGSISFGKVVFKDDEKIPESTKKSYQEVLRGEFLLNPLNLNYDLISLRIALSDKEVVVSSGYIVLKSQAKLDKNYYKWLLHRYDVAFMKTLGSGVRQTINYTDIGGSSLIWPPLSEQIAIAKFLDTKTALIDKAISVKEQQIALLKERRQAIIHKVVTQGLNPNVALKPSGVDWIGDIPEHWEVKRLKYLILGKLKYGANESGVDYDYELPRYVRITDFGMDGKLSNENRLSLTWKKGSEYLLKDGDILFARSGATVGKTYQFKSAMSVEKSYAFAGYLIKAVVNEQIISSDYLYLYTNSTLFEIWKEGIFIKATIENIGADKYAILPVVVPVLKDQSDILTYYKHIQEKISGAMALKEKEIEKLKEYKASLINSAVTGKIKVG